MDWYMYTYTFTIPKCSMYGIFTNIYHKSCPNVGKYAIHWASGIKICQIVDMFM